MNRCWTLIACLTLAFTAACSADATSGEDAQPGSGPSGEGNAAAPDTTPPGVASSPADGAAGGRADTKALPERDALAEPKEPVRSVSCGRDGAISHDRSCADLKVDCRAAGGQFDCKDAVPSTSCATWGTCSFPKPPSGTPAMPLPKELDANGGNPGPFEDISTFECGEMKVCCLWIPGKGDTSVDCGGWLDQCSAIGGKPSGGAHAASCHL